MNNVAADVPPESDELAVIIREHLDEVSTFATHLVGDADDAIEFVAGGIYHAAKYPPARLRADGRAALYRAVTRACRQQHRFPPRPSGPSRLFRRTRPPFYAEVDASAAARMNTVKRALQTIPFDCRVALLLRDRVGLDYRQMATALECSPEAVARLVARSRRDFGTVFREIRL